MWCGHGRNPASQITSVTRDNDAYVSTTAYNVADAWALSKGEVEDWSRLPEAPRTGTWIVITAIPILAAPGFSFHRIYWSRGVNGDYYVPDSMSHSIPFSLSVLAGMMVARTVLMPGK